MIVCKGDVSLGTACGKCSRCSPVPNKITMKPRITKMCNGSYLCLIPEDQVPVEDNATERDWYAYTACGMGATPREAYQDWVEDGGVLNI